MRAHSNPLEQASAHSKHATSCGIPPRTFYVPCACFILCAARQWRRTHPRTTETIARTTRADTTQSPEGRWTQNGAPSAHTARGTVRREAARCDGICDFFLHCALPFVCLARPRQVCCVAAFLLTRARPDCAEIVSVHWCFLLAYSINVARKMYAPGGTRNKCLTANTTDAGPLTSTWRSVIY